MLALLLALSCAPASDTAAPIEAPRRVEIIIEAGQTVQIVPLLPVGAVQCDDEGLCVSYTPDLRLQLGMASVTAPDDVELRLYWWE